MEKGIILVATGSPIYGRFAYNLAVTIKSVEDIPIMLLCSGAGINHLTHQQKQIFDIIMMIPQQAYSAKLMVYDYSPFERTIFLDVDMAWLPRKKPSQLFDELRHLDFTAITEGHYDYDANTEDAVKPFYHYWCNPQGAKEAYNLTGVLYQWRSELMYFRKCDQVKRMFEIAKEVHAAPKVEYQKFGLHVPDELGINIAACTLGIHPHVRRWKPAYWHRIHGEGKTLADIANNHYLLSVGGNFASSNMKKAYNTVVTAAHNKMGLQSMFPLQSKRETIPERKKM